MAELFGVNIPAISKHLNNIYDSGELNRYSTIFILETVQTEGNRTVKRSMEYFNLDAISKGKEFKPINISEERLELIEFISLDCTNATGK